MLVLTLMLVVFSSPQSPLHAHCFNHQLPLPILIVKSGVDFDDDIDVNLDANLMLSLTSMLMLTLMLVLFSAIGHPSPPSASTISYHYRF